MAEKRTIVIVGAGFGGVYTYQYLRSRINRRIWKIIIINKTDHFLFSPLLHEVATGGLAPDEVVEGIHLIIDRDCAELIKAEVTSVDHGSRTVHTTAGPVQYDHLVMALGSEINAHGVPGVAEHAVPLKTLADAEQLRARWARLFQQALQTTDPAERRRLLSVLIVGGGATGVELAAELAELFHHTFRRFSNGVLRRQDMAIQLVHAGDEVLDEFHPGLRRRAHTVLQRAGVQVHVKMRVAAVDGQGIVLEGGERMAASTVVWAAGVKPLTVPASPAWPLNTQHRIDVDDALRVRGHEQVWAIGDCAGLWPMRAQVAVQQAVVVARNIAATIEGTPLESFTFRKRGELVSLGQWQAVADIGGVQWKGPLAWFIWRMVYLFNFASWSKRLRIMLDWTIHLVTPRDITTAG